MKKPSNYIGEFEELVLLAILSQGDNAYGVTIRQALEEATARSISIGSLYTTLSRLEDPPPNEEGVRRSTTRSKDLLNLFLERFRLPVSD